MVERTTWASGPPDRERKNAVTRSITVLWAGVLGRGLTPPCPVVAIPVICIALLGAGCKSASVTEVRGKTSLGPEFRNRGNNTSEIRYDLRQAAELRWDNGWTTGMTYRRRDIDGGSGDNENLFLFELGYPIWKAPKKPDKTAMQIEELQKQIGELQSRLAGASSRDANSHRLARVEDTDNGQTMQKENGYAQP